jgi:hypothetical protein
MAKMRPPKIPEKPVPVLSDDHVRLLLADCSGKDFRNRRDSAIIRLFLDTGLEKSFSSILSGLFRTLSAGTDVDCCAGEGGGGDGQADEHAGRGDEEDGPGAGQCDERAGGGVGEGGGQLRCPVYDSEGPAEQPGGHGLLDQRVRADQVRGVARARGGLGCTGQDHGRGQAGSGGGDSAEAEPAEEPVRRGPPAGPHSQGE